jgi:hypothetical protein
LKEHRTYSKIEENMAEIIQLNTNNLLSKEKLKMQAKFLKVKKLKKI